MTTPIFIVGTPRSGTTWLANMMGRHSRIACVQESIPGGRGGVNESAFFSHVAGKFGDLKDDNNLIQLIETFASSTYFILSNCDKKIFYKDRPQTYHGFFRLFMDNLSDRQGADFWLEKTPSHMFHLDELLRYYQDVKFIAIKRDVIEHIKSTIKLDEVITGISIEDIPFIKKKKRILILIFKYHAYSRHLDRFRAKHPEKIWLTEYVNLKRTTKQVMQQLCAFLNIDFETAMVEKKYIPCSSFKTDDERKTVLSSAERKGIRMVSFLMRFIPYRLHRLMYLMRRAFMGRCFPFWFFSHNIEKYGWRNVFGKGHERVNYNSDS